MLGRNAPDRIAPVNDAGPLVGPCRRLKAAAEPRPEYLTGRMCLAGMLHAGKDQVGCAAAGVWGC